MYPSGRAAASHGPPRSDYSVPALVAIAAIVALTTALAVWLAASITRPLARLAARGRGGLSRGVQAGAGDGALPPGAATKVGQLARMFPAHAGPPAQAVDGAGPLDQFRRGAVGNLSHDLRSPLTATAACLETLQARGAAAPADRS